VIASREAASWLAGWQGTRGVLRRRLVPDGAAAREALIEDVTWLHGFLARLAGAGFPAPRPLPCFAGRSWLMTGGRLWEAVSYIAGHEVGWDSQPPLPDIGGLLARYHAAARQIDMPVQRPAVIPLADVPAILLSAGLTGWCGDAERAGRIRELAGRLAADLHAHAGPARERLVVHGDFTSHNVIADGQPPQLAGVIDFQRAHVEVPIADIAYALWRSGRPRQDASCLDLNRVRLFVWGYSQTAGLTAAEAAALPVFLYGRGLQMIARRVREGGGCTGILAEVDWISAHAGAIADTAAAAAAQPPS
jgi:Ser/Thr protein kinase RdoA (MazF antagonist)